MFGSDGQYDPVVLCLTEMNDGWQGDEQCLFFLGWKFTKKKLIFQMGIINPEVSSVNLLIGIALKSFIQFYDNISILVS